MNKSVMIAGGVLGGAINRRKLSYLLDNPAHRKFILVVISDI